MKAPTPLARLRGSRWQRLVIALFGVSAILIGLLAMHVLTGASVADTAAGHAAVSQVESDATMLGIGTAIPVEDCDDLCGPSHDMLSMICVLALMVVVVLLAVHQMLTRWGTQLQIGLLRVAHAVALATPTPPSLHVLSISRT